MVLVLLMIGLVRSCLGKVWRSERERSERERAKREREREKERKRWRYNMCHTTWLRNKIIH